MFFSDDYYKKVNIKYPDGFELEVVLPSPEYNKLLQQGNLKKLHYDNETEVFI